MIIGPLIILVLVLVLPFTFHKVERNLEVFLFVMGLAAAFLGGVLNVELTVDALVHPLPITGAVLGMGLVFKWTRKLIERGLAWVLARVPAHVLVFLAILLLGLLSSAITVIIASLILVEFVSVLKLQRKAEVQIVVLACYALGLGAALTPIGEPLSTIAVYKLSGEPYHAGFWFLVGILGPWVFPGIVGFAVLSLFFRERTANEGEESLVEAPEEVRQDESYRDVFVRALKVFLFIMALVFLGEGFKPIVDRYVIHLPALALYWINMVSAVLDNATLTAAELSPRMDLAQIRDILLGLLISGGMLIPGNIPNIIAANKLKIGSKEWAKFALPVGLAAMAVYFVLLLLVPGDKAPQAELLSPAGGQAAAAPFEVKLKVSDDRGLAAVNLLWGVRVIGDKDFGEDRPKEAEVRFTVLPEDLPPGGGSLQAEVMDSSGHRVRVDIPVR
jgi:predicted cation transporter